MSDNQSRAFLTKFLLLTIVSSCFFGFLGGIFYSKQQYQLVSEPSANLVPSIEQWSSSSCDLAATEAIRKAEDAVVSIVASKDLPIVEQYYINPFEEFFPGWNPFGFEMEIPQYRQKGVQKQEVSSGSGFIVSSNGYIVTNRHVVSDEEAEYTVLLNDGSKYKAEVVAKDPTEDFAVIKIEASTPRFLKLGDSDKVLLGQAVIAIGNALGEFRNTVSVGVISGLARSIAALDESGQQQVLNNVFQTDAAINKGNSGGPLLNFQGEVIGLNTAMVSGAQNIGFAIPVNKIKKALDQALTLGEIKIPFLGVRYVIVTPEIKEEKHLNVDYGALITKGDNGEEAVISDSAAEKAGLKEGDIILEFDGQKVDIYHPLSDLIRNKNIGETVTLKILRGEDILNISIILSEKPQEK